MGRNPTPEELVAIRAQYDRRNELVDELRVLEASLQRDIYALAKTCDVPRSSILSDETWQWQKAEGANQQGAPVLKPLFPETKMD